MHLLLLLLRHQLLLVFSLAAFGVAAFLFPVGIRASRQDSRTRRGNGSALFLLRHTKRGILVSIYAHNPHQSRGDERERTREEQRERMRTKERKRKRGSAREFKMREKRSLKKVAAIGTIGWTTSIAFFLRLRGHLPLSISISRVSRETLDPSPVLSTRFVKGVSRGRRRGRERCRCGPIWKNDKIKSPTTTHHKNVGNLISDFPVVINQRRRARAAGDERRHFRFVVFQQRRERCRCCCHDDARLSFSLFL